jgi:hypothetical protein
LGENPNFIYRFKTSSALIFFFEKRNSLSSTAVPLMFGAKGKPMQYSSQDIQALDRIQRLNLINSITGIKPANLIGTRSAGGQENLAIISSVVHMGSDPALVGFFSRPSTEVPRHTLLNLQETGVYTINHLPHSMTEAGHWTSAKFEREESEFEFCGFSQNTWLRMGLPLWRSPG